MMKQIFIFFLAFAGSLTALAEEASKPASSPTLAVPLPSAVPGQMTGVTPDEQLFFTTTRIEAKSADGKRTSVGTGFFVAVKVSGGHTIPFIVTCRHVVDGYHQATVTFVPSKDGKPQLGQRVSATISDLESYSFFNTDPTIDVAVLPLAPMVNGLIANGQNPFFCCLSQDMVPNDAAVADLSSIQPILFLGYPNGIRDEKNLLPIARRGITATPYEVDYNGLPLFLIDATVFPGSSGSPVLVFDQGSFPKKTGGIAFGDRSLFLGLVSEAYLDVREGEVQFKPIPTAVLPTYQQTTYLNLGVVVKSRVVFATIDQFLAAHPSLR